MSRGGTATGKYQSYLYTSNLDKIMFKMFAVASVVVIKKQKHALYFEIFFHFPIS